MLRIVCSREKGNVFLQTDPERIRQETSIFIGNILIEGWTIVVAMASDKSNRWLDGRMHNNLPSNCITKRYLSLRKFTN